MKPPRRTYRNEAEEAFAQAAERNGWTPCKRGWPDFWMERGGQLAVVEVKPHKNRKLTRKQRRIMQLLANHGVKVFKWTPDGGFEEMPPVKPRGEPTEGGEEDDGEAE